MHKIHWCGAIGLAIALVSTSAVADEMDAPEKARGPNDPKLYTPYGTSISAGGGVVGFMDEDMRDFADVGGAWDVRIVVGTRRHLAIEGAYTGGASSIDALGLDSSARLVSTGLETAARYNFLVEEWQPYVVAGVGWRRYDVTNDDFNTSSVQDKDNLFEVPVGAGIAYRYRGFVADARGVVRGAFGDDLVAASGQNQADLHNWQAQLTAGWEF